MAIPDNSHRGGRRRSEPDTPPPGTGRSAEAGRKLLRIAAHGQHAAVVDRARVQLIPREPIPGTNYRLIRWLGDIAVGTLYEAEDLQQERAVMLQVLRADLGTHVRAVRRARAEARVANDLGSPHIAQLFEFGELSDGRVMIVSEHLGGTRLRDLDGKMELPRLVPILRQLCKALAAAHSVGIVHGDIKPENVHLVEENGRADAVKLTGFGVASLLDEPGELGRTAGGSPYYLAPERWRGAPREPRSDIYAVGCLAYEAWTGSPPFAGDDLDEIMNGHCQLEPAALPARGHSRSLAAVIMRCLAKDPADRFENAEELEGALIEAQMAAKWITPWDALPPPELDDRRRQSLTEGLMTLATPQPAPASMSASRQPQAKESGQAEVPRGGGGLAWVAAVLLLLGGATATWMHYGTERIVGRVRAILQPQVAAQVDEPSEAEPAGWRSPTMKPTAPGEETMQAEVVDSEPEVKRKAKSKKKRRRSSRRRRTAGPRKPTAPFAALPGPEEARDGHGQLEAQGTALHTGDPGARETGGSGAKGSAPEAATPSNSDPSPPVSPEVSDSVEADVADE